MPSKHSRPTIRCSSCGVIVEEMPLASCDDESKTYICGKCMRDASSFYFLFARHSSQKNFIKIYVGADLRSIAKYHAKYQNAGFAVKIVRRPFERGEDTKIGLLVPWNYIDGFLPKPGESL